MQSLHQQASQPCCFDPSASAQEEGSHLTRSEDLGGRMLHGGRRERGWSFLAGSLNQICRAQATHLKSQKPRPFAWCYRNNHKLLPKIGYNCSVGRKCSHTSRILCLSLPCQRRLEWEPPGCVFWEMFFPFDWMDEKYWSAIRERELLDKCIALAWPPCLLNWIFFPEAWLSCLVNIPFKWHGSSITTQLACWGIFRDGSPHIAQIKKQFACWWHSIQGPWLQIIRAPKNGLNTKCDQICCPFIPWLP